MSGIQPPWPPDGGYIDPLPYDQRGSCWPQGPCSLQSRTQLRYSCIGGRDVGAIASVWGRFKTGQTLVTRGDLSTKKSLVAQGDVETFIVDTLTLWLPSNASPVWDIKFVGLVDVGEGIFQEVYGETQCDLEICELGFQLPLTFPISGGSTPEWLMIKPVFWYETAPFPYLGT